MPRDEVLLTIQMNEPVLDRVKVVLHETWRIRLSSPNGTTVFHKHSNLPRLLEKATPCYQTFRWLKKPSLLPRFFFKPSKVHNGLFKKQNQGRNWRKNSGEDQHHLISSSLQPRHPSSSTQIRKKSHPRSRTKSTNPRHWFESFREARIADLTKQRKGDLVEGQLNGFASSPRQPWSNRPPSPPCELTRPPLLRRHAQPRTYATPPRLVA